MWRLIALSALFVLVSVTVILMTIMPWLSKVLIIGATAAILAGFEYHSRVTSARRN